MEFQLNLQDLLITWLYIIIYPIESPLSPDKRVGKSHDSPTIYLCICNISFPITYPRFGWCTAKAYANFMKQIPYSSWWNRLFHYFWWLIPHFFFKIISCWSNSCVLYIYISRCYFGCLTAHGNICDLSQGAASPSALRRGRPVRRWTRWMNRALPRPKWCRGAWRSWHGFFRKS